MLEDFRSPRHQWVEMSDVVMSGKSRGNFSVGENGAHFTGAVEIVDFLGAPGFIKSETKANELWPDISSCEGLVWTVDEVQGYGGFRVSFGKNRPPDAFPYTYGYKADLVVNGSGSVYLPFDSFTDKWDAKTGDPIRTCQEDPSYCPDLATKQNLYSLAIWAEGVQGAVDLKIERVEAYGCGKQSDTTQADEVVIEDFSSPKYKWTTLNDPVMGGKSHSSLEIKDGVASFAGVCAIVPSLQAPGFITMRSGGIFHKDIFPDVSLCSALKINMRSTVEYTGYRLSFGTDRVPGGRYAMGYKAPFSVGSSFSDVVLPFSLFSDNWNDATGDIKVECADDPKYCPSQATLQNMKTMSFWGEGVEGLIGLEIKSISAIGCSSKMKVTDSSRQSGGFFALAILVLGLSVALTFRSRTIGGDHSYEMVPPVTTEIV